MDKRPALLVAVLDADLREASFTRLSAAGFRVDAVADTRSGLRRLECDEYGLVVVEADGPFEDLETQLPVLPVDSESVEELVQRAESELGLSPQPADPADPDDATS